MAAGSNFDPDTFTNNPVFNALDDRISQILRKCGSTPKSDVIEELLLDFESKLLEESRDIVFSFAQTKVNDAYTANGGTIPEGVKIELRKRRTPANYALDMVDLVLYVGGAVVAFPKDVLSKESTYVEIDKKRTDDKTQGSTREPCQQVIKQGTSGSDKCCCIAVKEEMKKHATLLLTLKDFVLNSKNISVNDLNSAFKVIDFRGSNSHQTVNGQNSTSASHTSDGEANSGPPGATQPAQPAPPASQPAAQPDTQATQQKSTGDANAANGNGGNESTPTEGAESQPGSTNQGTMMTPDPARGQAAGKSSGPGLQQKPIFIGSKPSFVGNLSDDREPKDTSGKWQIKESKAKSGSKKNVKLSGGKPKNSNTPLTGRSYKTTDLYVQDITRHEGDSLIDIANRVRAHCQGHDIRVTFARVYPKRYCTETVNCRISVPLDDIDSVLGIRIWPDGVVCRRWQPEPPKRNYSEKPTYRGNNYRKNNDSWGSRHRRQYDDDDYESDCFPDHWEDRYNNGDERYGGRYNKRY